MTESFHGTVGGYTNHKCRCPECAGAYREYSRRRQRERAKTTPPEHVHGTTGGYTNWSCRCEACSDAMRAYRDRKTEAVGA